MSTSPKLTVVSLIDIVKREAARRDGSSVDAPPDKAANPQLITSNEISPKYLVATPRRHVRDFVPLLGEEFVHEAFKTLLWRPADLQAKEAYLAAIACGRASRWEILLRIRLSAEGRTRGVGISWLFPAALFSIMFRLPILGLCLNATAHALSLPTYLRDTRQQDIATFAMLRALGR